MGILWATGYPRNGSYSPPRHIFILKFMDSVPFGNFVISLFSRVGPTEPDCDTLKMNRAMCIVGESNLLITVHRTRAENNFRFENGCIYLHSIDRFNYIKNY